MKPSEPPIATIGSTRGCLVLMLLITAFIIYALVSGAIRQVTTEPLTSDNSGILIILSLGGLVYGFGVWLPYYLKRLVRGLVVNVYNDGLTYGRQTIAWSDIDGVAFPEEQPVRRIPNRLYPALVVQGRRRWLIDGYFREPNRLVNLIIDHTLAAKTPTYHAMLQAGQAITYDKLTLTADAVTDGNTTLRRDAIKRVVWTKRATSFSTGDQFLYLDHRNPHAPIVAAYMVREWLPPRPPTDLHDSEPPELPLEVKERVGHLRLDETGVTVTRTDADRQHYGLAMLAYVYTPHRLAPYTLLSNGEPVLTFRSVRFYIVLIQCLAHLHYPTYRQRLADGQPIDFGQVRLWPDRVTYLPTAQTIDRRKVRYVKDSFRGVDFMGFDWLPLLHIPIRAIHNPDLFIDCLAISGGWGSKVYFRL